MGDCNTIIRGKKVNGGFSVFNVMLVDYLEWISGMFGVVITNVLELVICGMLKVVNTTVLSSMQILIVVVYLVLEIPL